MDSRITLVSHAGPHSGDVRNYAKAMGHSADMELPLGATVTMDGKGRLDSKGTTTVVVVDSAPQSNGNLSPSTVYLLPSPPS